MLVFFFINCCVCHICELHSVVSELVQEYIYRQKIRRHNLLNSISRWIIRPWQRSKSCLFYNPTSAIDSGLAKSPQRKPQVHSTCLVNRSESAPRGFPTTIPWVSLQLVWMSAPFNRTSRQWISMDAKGVWFIQNRSLYEWFINVASHKIPLSNIMNRFSCVFIYVITSIVLCIFVS